ncbi:MAG: S-formylglutathione hydrolase [Pseudomonadales bacterium]
MTIRTLGQVRAFGGQQSVFAHESTTLNCTMEFAAFVPDLPDGSTAPVLLWLSGLTCTHENFSAKAGAQRIAAELGLILLMPDTSPRGERVADDPAGAYDFGLGAGFYVDATQQPYAEHYHMRSYIEQELLSVAATVLPVDLARVSISGHSMGGHGALTLALRSPERYRSVSAFAPICAPMECPWGRKALTGYLGEDRSSWRSYDACALIADGARLPELLVDQGADDGFLQEQLQPQKLQQACAAAGIKLELRMQPGYDHSYYFIATYIEDHLRWHALRLQS